jgi:hypothetical protein
MADRVRETIERMTAERGTKDKGIWRATFTVKEVLARAEMPNTSANHRYVLYQVKTWYAGSTTGAPQHDNGGTINIRIRSV